MEERVEMAKSFKEKGNEEFKKGDLEEADVAYDQAIDYVDFGNEVDGSTELRMSSYLN